MSKHEIKTSYKIIKNVVKILELLGDRLEVCVSVIPNKRKITSFIR